jgi:hypothetical protein
MIDLSHEQTLLLRVLTSFFGKDRVIPLMRVAAVCGGNVPHDICAVDNEQAKVWADENRALCTLVDQNDVPRVVVDFCSKSDDAIEFLEVERRKFMQPIMHAAGIIYVAVNEEELAELLDPSNSLDILSLIGLKSGLIDDLPG